MVSPWLGCRWPYSSRARHDWRGRCRSDALDFARRPPVWPTVVVASGNDALLVETRYDDVLDFATFFRAFSLLDPARGSPTCGMSGRAVTRFLGFPNRDQLLSKRHWRRAGRLQRVRRDTDADCVGRSGNRRD